MNNFNSLTLSIPGIIENMINIDTDVIVKKFKFKNYKINIKIEKELVDNSFINQIVMHQFTGSSLVIYGKIVSVNFNKNNEIDSFIIEWDDLTNSDLSSKISYEFAINNFIFIKEQKWKN